MQHNAHIRAFIASRLGDAVRKCASTWPTRCKLQREADNEMLRLWVRVSETFDAENGEV